MKLLVDTPFEAQYRHMCSLCEVMIKEHDFIYTENTDGIIGYCHATCIDKLGKDKLTKDLRSKVTK